MVRSKILILICTFVLVSMSIVSASPSSESADYYLWYEKARELQYKLEIGVSYREYSTLFSDLYAGWRNLGEQYPKDNKYVLSSKVLRSYQGYKQIWEFNNSLLPSKSETPELKEMREAVAGRNYQELLFKNDPNYFQEIEHRVKALDPLTEKYPKRPWLASNAQKVLIEDAIKYLDDLKTTFLN